MKDVQQRGGSYEQQSVFVGLPRQITVDETNQRLLLHDGVAVGGHIIAPRDECDDRYQAKSGELDGFDFDPSLKGIPVRTAPGTYALRKIDVGDGLNIVNPYGIAGDFTFSLTAAQPGDHQWQGVNEFVNPIQGNLEGNVTGNTNGTHTGAVTGDVTGNLEGNTEGNHVGGIDARGAEVFFDVNQIPSAAIAGLDAALAGIPGALPTGVILMWHGDTTDIPAGYFLCDGTNGTPDLQDKFIIGAGDSYDPHAVGGSTAFTPHGTVDSDGSHAHAITVGDHNLLIAEIPAHTHTVACGTSEGDNTTNFTNGNNSLGPTVATSSSGGGNPHSHPGSSDLAGTHTHGFTGSAATIVPPFYALCYIMKG